MRFTKTRHLNIQEGQRRRFKIKNTENTKICRTHLKQCSKENVELKDVYLDKKGKRHSQLPPKEPRKKYEQNKLKTSRRKT